MIHQPLDPFSIQAEADELFIFAPSVIYAESLACGTG